jgi:CheY-like chemotaxis protein
MAPTVPWLANRHERIFTASLEDDCRVTVEHFEHAIPALQAFTKNKYHIIFMDVEVAPGIDEYCAPGPYLNDPRITELMGMRSQWGATNPDYWRIGLFVIQETRKSAPNKDTPIIVVSYYDPTGDPLFPDAQKQSLAAGATEYVAAFKMHPRDQIKHLTELCSKAVRAATGN